MGGRVWTWGLWGRWGILLLIGLVSSTVACAIDPRLSLHQLHHKAWAGLNFEDQIFPMFVFIAGVSLVVGAHVSNVP